MELKASTVLGLLVALILMVQALALPLGAEASENGMMDEQKRPKYMDTRDLKSFKELLFLALGELVDESVISANIFSRKGATGDVTKRGRPYIGMCFTRSANGAVHAEPCWRNEAQ